jgi:tRNA dimethylallyltransferase
MVAAGWLAEVERLIGWGYTRACAAMNSLGYRELLAYVAGEMDWDETVAAIKKATCHLAKRQLTWFRKMTHVPWFNLSTMDEQRAIVTLVQHLQAALEDRKSWVSGAQNVDAVVEG